MVNDVSRSRRRGATLDDAVPWLYIVAMLVYYVSLQVTQAWQVIALQSGVLLMAILAAAGLRTGLSYMVVALMALNVPSTASWDRITSVAAFEHICDLPSVVARCGVLLKPGGQLRVAIPSEGTLLSPVRNHCEQYDVVVGDSRRTTGRRAEKAEACVARV